MNTPKPNHPIRRTLKHLALASAMGAAIAMMSGSAGAAPITWGPVSVFNDATDVNANGLSTTVSAGANYAGTVNGVLFTDQQPGTLSSFNSSGNYGSGVFLDDTGSSAEQNAFDALVGTQNWNDPQVPSNTISLSGLTDGQAYRIQAIFADDRSASFALTGTLGDLDGGTPSVSIKRGVAGLKASGNTIYGDFTADGDGIQEFTVNGNIQMLTGYVLTTTVNLTLTTIVTVPANGAAYLVGSAIPATATVQNGTAPYTVEFFLNNGSGFVSQGTDMEAPYTKNLTGLAIGSYSLKTTVTDSTSATDDSPTRTFTVSNTGPTNLVAVPGNQLMKLSWNPVLGATGYKVFRSSPDNSSYSEIATGITGLTYQDTSLTIGMTYYYVVRATVGATVSEPSNEVSMTAVNPPPVADYVRWFDASTLGLPNGAPVTTWPDASVNSAHATVPSGNTPPAYVANAGTGSGLGALYFAKNSGPSNSAALRFTRETGVRTVFSVFKGNSFLLTDAATYDFSRPSDVNPADPLWDATYANGSIRNGSTYVNGTLVTGTTFPMPTSPYNGFNLVEVLTTGAVNADSFNKDRTYHSGNQYHAEVIIYNRVLTESERLAVEAYLSNKWFNRSFTGLMYTFGPGAIIFPAAANKADISWTVPYGSNPAALSPTFTMEPGATCTVNGTPVVSGSTQNFTNPVHYIVRAADFATSGKTIDYTVTVNVTPASTGSAITTCDFGALGQAEINEAAGTVVLTVPPGQSVTALAPTFTLSPNATISPASGSTRNFTNPVVYRVTAQDGTTFKDYSVSVQTFSTWAHSGSMFILTTPDGANLPAGASVSNFPVLIRFNSSNFNFATAQSDGRDIRFATPAGDSLSFEIEEWDSINGRAAVWVKIPTITGNARQEISMFWGKSGVSSQSNGPAVFNSTNGYAAVMHLNGNVLDSTGSISPFNGGATPTTAVIGSTAMNLATGDITAGNITNFPSGTNFDSTGQIWFRLREIGVASMPLAWGNEDGYGENKWKMHIGFWGSVSFKPSPVCLGPEHVYGSTVLARDQWYHLVYTKASGTGRLYVNGVLDSTGSGGSFSAITNPQGLSLEMNGGDGDVDEARISKVARSADWVKLEYENQKPVQTLVGGLVPSGSNFSVTPNPVTMNEAATTTLTAQAGGAQKVYWILKKNGQDTVIATDQLTFNYTAPRVTGNDSAVIQFKAVFAGGTQTIDVPLAVIDTVPDPVFTLVPSTTSWDGCTTMTVTANISNLAAMQAAGFGTLNYKWSVSGVAVTKQTSNGTLTLTRSQGSGPMNVSLTIDNGGNPVSQSTIINVQEPASDPWVQRTPAANEKPVTKQFFARDPGTGLGTVHYRGTQSGATDVYLKVYTTDTGADVLYATHRQTLAGGAYSFAAPIAAGKVTYKVTYGTTSGGNDSAPLATVTDLVCGDAFIIEGQSNALATDNSAPNDTTTTNKWVRTYGLTSGWGYAISKGNDLQLGLWGWYLANRLVTNHSMPVCIINAAVGGTRIDVHRPNPTNHALPLGTGYGENSYADLYNRVVGAKLTHGIRGLLWHQGEQSQGSGGIDPDYDYKFYQQYFVDISAAWKQDFPNLRNYYLFQIWPAACGDTSRNDQLREVQRTLPRLYSNMKIMSTHGIVPGSGCHYVPEGYQVFSDLIGPLVEQDVYGVNPTAKLTAPNLQQAYFTTPAKNEIALVFDQNVAWNPGATTMLFLANSAGATSGSVSSGSATGNTIKLQVSGASSAVAITYLKGLVSWLQPNILYGSNGIAALTFADVPIGTLSPYGTWAGSSFANAFTDTAATSDPDGDGQNNQEEFAFGLDPTTGSSVNPITQQLAGGVFKYTRTKNSGLTYKVYYSTNLSGWTLDAAATQSPAAAVAGVETVTVTLAAAVPTDGKLFVRVAATPTP
jgi:hypothetical protein